MDIISLLVFFIYALIILLILVYVSPLLSAAVLIIVPVVIILLLPDLALGFLSVEQFSFVVPVNNIHILLFIWSAFIGIIAYAEVVSWYLLREAKPKPQPKSVPEPGKPGDQPKKEGKTLKDYIQKFLTVMKGKKT
ncbi:MAG: hypothetical protein FIB08_06655 [Candidatus Methanoperedens sp.]|nr:hypothetical protein [Candidatus Methanoperedens sp.]